jgi:ATP synthase protein I
MLSGNRHHDMTAVRRVALTQAGLGPAVALLGAAMLGRVAGLALLYGGFVAFAVSLVLAWRERQARRHPEWDQHRLLKQFIRTGVERLVVLTGLLGLGLGVLNLAPLPMLLGLLVAQLAWLAAVWGR